MSDTPESSEFQDADSMSPTDVESIESDQSTPTPEEGYYDFEFESARGHPTMGAASHMSPSVGAAAVAALQRNGGFNTNSALSRRGSAARAMMSTRSARDDSVDVSVDAEVVSTYVEASERVANSRRLTAAQQPAKAKAALKGVEELKQEVTMDEHIISVNELCQRLETSLERGLTSEQHAARLARDGANVLTPPKQVPGWIKLGKHLFFGFSGLLWIGAILCFIAYGIDQKLIDNAYLGGVLLLVVLITAFFAYYQEGQASKAMEGFAKMVPDAAVVLRDGNKTRVEASDLVVGDIVEVKGGDKIPADIRIIESNNFKVDNSSLTGESEAQTRSAEFTNDNPLETKNLSFFASFAVDGVATGIVVNTGDRTVIGRIASLVLHTKQVQTPLAREINRFIRIISIVALIIGITFLVISLLIGYDVLTAIVFVIGIVVANVPEGLLATVTVSLTLTAKRMANKNVLVKSLQSVETLGSTSTICSDKTGTLTQNKMTASHLAYGNAIYSNDTGTSGSYDINDPTCRSLMRVAALCNRATFADDAVVQAAGRTATRITVQEWRTIGDASESALIKLVHVNRDIYEWREANRKIAEVPFNSTNKYQISIHESEDAESMGRLLLVMKGAPERIIGRCTTQVINGTEVKLGKTGRKAFDEAYADLAKRGERVLGFCHLWLDAKQYTKKFAFDVDNPNFPTEGLVFDGLISLIDPPRESVPEAVRNCQSAGIQVIMVTGDHPLTAESIARQVGIIQSETANEIAESRGCSVLDVPVGDARAIVIHGELLRDMSEEQLDEVLKHQEIVFARTSPQQKLRIVEGCQRRGDIVAVTGDGVNDSPALKKADIGIAMGIAGSDVSKEAAKMILQDDDFSSIVKGVEEGRLVFDNLKKSIAYTVSSNIPEIVPFLAFIVLRIPLALTTFLVLCIDIGTDMLPAISLAYEEAESDIMMRRPRNAKHDKLVNIRLVGFAYFIVGIAQLMSGFFSFFVVIMSELRVHPLELIGTEHGNSDTSYGFSGQVPFDMWLGGRFVPQPERVDALHRGQSAYLLSIVIVQWADLLICKTRKLSLFQQGMRNRVLWLGLFVETLVAVLLIYVPFLQDVFNTLDLDAIYWLSPLPFAFLIFGYDEIRKAILRRNRGTGFPAWVTRMTYY
jgi:sodium/potassium-transporting ATPase subunit alpha